MLYASTVDVMDKVTGKNTFCFFRPASRIQGYFFSILGPFRLGISSCFARTCGKKNINTNSYYLWLELSIKSVSVELWLSLYYCPKKKWSFYDCYRLSLSYLLSSSCKNFYVAQFTQKVLQVIRVNTKLGIHKCTYSSWQDAVARQGT